MVEFSVLEQVFNGVVLCAPFKYEIRTYLAIV